MCHGESRYGTSGASCDLRMSDTGRNSPPLLLEAPMMMCEEHTHRMICAVARWLVNWQVSYSEFDKIAHIVSNTIESGHLTIIHQGETDRYVFFCVRGNTCLWVNGGEACWKIIEYGSEFLSWVLPRLTDKPVGYEE